MEKRPPARGPPNRGAHGCRRVLLGIDHELDGHREKAQQDDSRDEDGTVAAHLYWTNLNAIYNEQIGRNALRLECGL